MTAEDLVKDQQIRSRAYNLLYAWEDENPITVREIDQEEAERLVQLAHEVAMGMRTTPQHREIAAKVRPAMLRYVAIGKF